MAGCFSGFGSASARAESKATTWFKQGKAKFSEKRAELTGNQKHIEKAATDKNAADLAQFKHDTLKGVDQGKKMVTDAYSSASSTISKGYSSVKSSITGEKPPATFTDKAKAWGEKAWGGNKIYENHATKWLDKTFSSSNKAQ